MDVQYHSCAVSSGGAVSCWGDNDYGQVMLLLCFYLFEKCVACVFATEDIYLVAYDVFACAAWRGDWRQVL